MANSNAEMAGKLVGEWQQPINKWSDQPGSIHNDEVAHKVGMRGGTIPGTVHLDHFVPLIKSEFGMRWFQQGSISMYYTFATTNKEDVRAIISKPGGDQDEQVDALIETPDGKTVGKGTLAVGNPKAQPYVRTIPLENAPADQLRILSALEVGQATADNDDIILTEGGDSGEYEGIITSPSLMYTHMQAKLPRTEIAQAVGFFGATEIILRNGPIRLDTPYRSTGKVVCLGASPKTEFFYIDTCLYEKSSGELIAEMRKLTRFMKASAPVWEE
jgi:hypothetical protein